MGVGDFQNNIVLIPTYVNKNVPLSLWSSFVSGEAEVLDGRDEGAR